MTAAPSITNYQIPTGKVYWLDDDNPTAGEVDLGNCVNFSVSNDVTKKDHFRSYGGQRTKDKTLTTQVASNAKFVLDEITTFGVAMFTQGTIAADPNTDGSYDITALTKTDFTGILHVVGDNDVGPQLDWIGRVSMSPSTGDFFLIQDNDNWNQISISAGIEEDVTYGFGKWTLRATGAGL